MGLKIILSVARNHPFGGCGVGLHVEKSVLVLAASQKE
ncbi:MAG: hypothetical protein AVDCRST_MAG93-6391 [uncultured Chloroflexia bacterium]|uniref:Uncharacterized protein n=1 Tax=uncultured Chloroflexia bacterium TaxID=1672391 RepID=A0A6J4LMA6_9CHLR|nr:MAG: hypothetical protein AVDCRST_MAG93-6391 [uncultured Chloroflexia bacterium]